MPDTCIIHIAWKPLGPDWLARFLRAYRAMPAGLPHRLVIVYNGFAPGEMAPYEELLRDVAHEVLRLPDPVQDISAYFAAAHALRCEYLCFCNSYSEPLVPGWLALLHAHARRPDIGLAGAGGSWESHHTNLRRVYTLAGLARLVAGRLRGRPRDATGGASAHVAGAAPRPGFLARAAMRRREFARARAEFEPFPAPHLRTNGLMVRRERFLQLERPIRDKFDALAFESGRSGLTRVLRAAGLRAVVVGRDGVAYEPHDWWRCGAYRSGRQENLLIADNRTREFDAFDDDARAAVLRATWGEDPARVARDIAAAGG